MKLRLIHFAGLLVMTVRNRLERITKSLNALYAREIRRAQCIS